jgi:hypothetical protein
MRPIGGFGTAETEVEHPYFQRLSRTVRVQVSFMRRIFLFLLQYTFQEDPSSAALIRNWLQESCPNVLIYLRATHAGRIAGPVLEQSEVAREAVRNTKIAVRQSLPESSAARKPLLNGTFGRQRQAEAQGCKMSF